MPHPAEHKPHMPQIEDLDPPMPPDPDEVAPEGVLEDGRVPALISDDPEHARTVDPEGGFDDWPPRATGDSDTDGP